MQIQAVAVVQFERLVRRFGVANRRVRDGDSKPTRQNYKKHPRIWGNCFGVSAVTPPSCRMLLSDVTPHKTKKAIKNRHLGRLMYFVRLSWISKWWTRRELNPRPKAINGQDYMFSSVI